MKTSRDNLLIVSDSDRDADMLYATGFFAPDPFIYGCFKGSEVILISDLEFDRATRTAQHCEAIPFSKAFQSPRLRRKGMEGLAGLAWWLLKEYRVSSVKVPFEFPHGLASALVDEGIRVKPSSGSIFPEREFKTPAEVRKISKALRMTEEGIRAGIALLKKTRPDSKGRLMLGKTMLTSERLRSEIDGTINDLGGKASHTIVACGNHAVEAHEVGHGPLKANQTIILDVFPRDMTTGYFGDITRTVVRGRASDRVHELYQAVHDAREAAIDAVAPGVRCKAVDGVARDLFLSRGFQTGRMGGRMQGFYHGTGHGVGLQIHEAPRVSPKGTGCLREGQVLTIEPGLYYHRIGGVRLEDVVVVTAKGARNLTRIESVLEV